MFDFFTNVIQKIGAVIGAGLIAVGGLIGGQSATEERKTDMGSVPVAVVQASSTVEVSGDTSDETNLQKTEAKTSLKQENFSSTVTSALDGQIAYNNDVIEYIDEMLTYANSDLKRMEKTQNDTATVATMYGADNTTNALLGYYRSIINYIKVQTSELSKGKALLESAGADYRQRRLSYSSKFVTRQEAVVELQKLQGEFDSTTKMRDAIKMNFEDYTDSRAADDSKLEMAFKMLESQSDVTYTPPPSYSSPQIQIPKTTSTRCTVGAVGDTIYCDSYTY